jgi:hypothetical protein
MTWQLSYNQAGELIPADISFRNVLGSPISAVNRIAPYAAGCQTPPAGIFIVTAIDSDKVIVEPKGSQDLKSPALNSSPITVVADGATWNTNVIPGLAIKFGVFYAAYQAEIGVGCVWDSSAHWWQRITALGLGLGGVSGADISVIATNTGTDQSNSQVVVTNAARLVNSASVSRPFFSFQQVGTLNPTPDESAEGTLIAFDNYVAGSPGTVDILADGVPINVFDVTHWNLIIGGSGLLCDGLTVYRFADGTAYQSCEFVLSPDLAEMDTAQIYVSDGGAFVELFDDLSGDYVPGTTSIYLTSTGCGMGVVLSEDSVNFRMRLSPPASKDISLNQRQFSIRICSEGV